MPSKSSQESMLYEFGPFRLDPSQRVLLRDGELIPLAPKAFDTLRTLVENQGRVVGKDELLKKVWPDVFVEEGSLTQNISILRRALGEGAEGGQYIQTIPKRGYRLVVPVNTPATGVEAPNPAAAEPVRSSPRTLRVAASAVLAIALAGAYIWWRHSQTAPLTDRDVIVLADFTNRTGDPAFDATLRDSLAYQLEQSPFLKVLDDAVVQQDLQLMRRSPRDRITNDLAHDICVREAEKAMLGGSIAGLGKGYVIELLATNCQTGATLARQQAQAADKEHVLDAIGVAAKGMRSKLGESLTSIEKLAPPTDAYRVATSSIEAFQAFIRGGQMYREGRLSEAIPLLERATELDPNLAQAWGFLSTVYLNAGGSRERAVEYGERAWALRDKTSAYERLFLTSNRAGQTTGQYITNFEEWSRTYPRDAFPVIGLGRVYTAGGDFEKALPYYEKAYALQSRNPIYLGDMMLMYRRMDRFADAKRVAEKAFSQGVDGNYLHVQLMLTAEAENDGAGVTRQARWFTGKPEEDLDLWYMAGQARFRGRMREARELSQRAADLARLRNLPEAAARFLAPDASWDALLGNCATARATKALSDDILAMCGDEALAKRGEEENKRWVSGSMTNPAKIALTQAAAEFGLGHTAAALELLKSAAPYERAWPFTNYLRGLAYLRLKKDPEAASEFQKILDHRGNNWGPYYPLSYVGLARAAALAGDQARATGAYRAFLDLWKDADPGIPLLVQVRRESAALKQ